MTFSRIYTYIITAVLLTGTADVSAAAGAGVDTEARKGAAEAPKVTAEVSRVFGETSMPDDRMLKTDLVPGDHTQAYIGMRQVSQFLDASNASYCAGIFGEVAKGFHKTSIQYFTLQQLAIQAQRLNETLEHYTTLREDIAESADLFRSTENSLRGDGVLSNDEAYLTIMVRKFLPTGSLYKFLEMMCPLSIPVARVCS